ncbi:MAG: apolipoprotein N-acyltransferase [Pseudomonadota bacterium]
MAETGRRRLLALGLGCLAAAGQAPLSLPFLTMIALGGGFWLLQQGAAPRPFWLGWLFGVGYFAASLFWIVEPFLVEPERHGWMAPFALVLIAGGFAVFWALAFSLAARVAGRMCAWRGVLAFASAMAAVELLRTYLLTGFPWALVGHVWVGWAPMHLAAWIGPVGLSFVTLLLSAGAAHALVQRAWPNLGALAVLGIALFATGAWQASRPTPDAAGAPVVRLVQPNAEQHLKWDPDHALSFFERMLAFSAAPGEGGGPRPDLIVWPENAVVQVLNRAETWLDHIAAAASGVPVIFGIQRLDDADRARNALVVMGPGGTVDATYDKHHLVPFGEYLPLAAYFDLVGQKLLGQGMGLGYVPGPGAQVLELPGRLGRALPLICYEGIFPHNIAAAPARPDFMVLITNDAWFGELAGPYQHLAQARLRAVEFGLPMVRVANTGVSAVIDARGRVMAEIPLGQAGWRDVPLPRPLSATFYSRTGDWPMGFLLAALLAGLGLIGRRRPIDASAPSL